MLKHRKITHKTFKPCKNFPDCDFNENCLFNHNMIDEGKFICYVCGNQYNELSDRKTIHGTNKCQKFLKNKCWYSHGNEEVSNKVVDETIIPEKEPEHSPKSASVFRHAPENLAPPSDSQTVSQAMWIKITDLKQMMEEIKEFQC